MKCHAQKTWLSSQIPDDDDEVQEEQAHHGDHVSQEQVHKAKELRERAGQVPNDCGDLECYVP